MWVNVWKPEQEVTAQVVITVVCLFTLPGAVSLIQPGAGSLNLISSVVATERSLAMVTDPII